MKVLVQSVVRVVEVVAASLACFEHVAVEGEDARSQRVRQVGEQGAARLLGQVHDALASPVEVVEGEILDLLALGPINRPLQADGRERHFQQGLQQVGRKGGGRK